ncbi:MAG: prefoldin subunit alpha [Candidatus Micrarchaeota archaeon]
MSEEELNKLAYEAQYLQQQAQEMQRQLQQAIAIASQLEAAAKTIEGLKDNKEEDYFQLGGGAFIKAKTAENSGILMDIGAGVFAEKNPEEAKELMQKRKKDVEKAMEILKNNLQKLTRRLQEIDGLAEDLQQ